MSDITQRSSDNMLQKTDDIPTNELQEVSIDNETMMKDMLTKTKEMFEKISIFLPKNRVNTYTMYNENEIYTEDEKIKRKIFINKYFNLLIKDNVKFLKKFDEKGKSLYEMILRFSFNPSLDTECVQKAQCIISYYMMILSGTYTDVNVHTNTMKSINEIKNKYNII